MTASSSVLVRLVDHLTGRDGRHEAPVTLDAAEPVLDEAAGRARAAAAIASVVSLAVAVGLVGPGDASLLTGVLVVVAGAVLAVANAVLVVRRAYRVRAQVTPVRSCPARSSTRLSTSPPPTATPDGPPARGG